MMATNTVIYCKQTGKPSIPVTVRVEWLPDGKIKPLMYWTPDGFCYQINHIYEMSLLAFLKDRGEGMRFKVKAEIIEITEPDDELLHAQFVTYLFFADNFFCGKNFIDDRYGHDDKMYISVIIDFFPDAGYELIYFWVKGVRYMVEQKMEVKPRGSFYAGGVGVWHKVKARLVNAHNDDDPDPDISIHRMAALTLEINKWFVAVKTV